MKAKRVCRRCYGHAVSLEDVTAPTRVFRAFVVSPKGFVHRPVIETGKTECGWSFDHWVSA